MSKYDMETGFLSYLAVPLAAGIFISSGIIYMKEDDVKEAVKKNENLQLTDVVKQGDWRAVMAKLQ